MDVLQRGSLEGFLLSSQEKKTRLHTQSTRAEFCIHSFSFLPTIAYHSKVFLFPKNEHMIKRNDLTLSFLKG